MMTESAFSIEELEELYCLFKVKELQAADLTVGVRVRVILSLTPWGGGAPGGLSSAVDLWCDLEEMILTSKV